MRFDLLTALYNYKPIDDNDNNNLVKMMDFIKTDDNCFDRKNFKGHVTAGALIMDKSGNVLINHHKDIDLWLMFGGHSDGNSDSLSVAKREVKEETDITEYDDCN